ncbi:MAG: monofunctional biosynthetic peptidoglycan transglycosylase [Pseudomonadota bacterium]
MAKSSRSKATSGKGSKRGSARKKRSPVDELITQKDGPTKVGPTRSSSRLRRITRWVVKRVMIIAIILILLPIGLIALYTVPAIKPVSTLMVWQGLSGTEIKRDWIALDDMSPHVVQAIISSEDGKFCSHAGVDWDAVNTVIDDVMDGERPRGASTVSMQTAKNLFLWNSRSFIRKGLEVPLALASDRVWGKRRMMEIYLNIAEWGPGIFGIEAAAQHHFGRSAARLSRRQASRLAVTLPSPLTRDPANPSRSLARMARRVEQRARQSGAYIRCLRSE